MFEYALKKLVLEVLIAAFLKKRKATLVTTALKKLVLEVLLFAFLKKRMATLVTTALKKFVLEVLLAAFLKKRKATLVTTALKKLVFRSTSGRVPEETQGDTSTVYGSKGNTYLFLFFSCFNC